MNAVETLSDLRTARRTTLDDGGEAARKRAASLDRALSELAHSTLGDEIDLAVVAVGGYGRAELSPHSDVDLLFLVGRDGPGTSALRELLYPLWDSGWTVGHAARTPKQAITHARGDLHAATALLTARLVAGDQALFDELRDRQFSWSRSTRKAIARAVMRDLDERRATTERAGWALAPDIKDDIGGLRDGHVLTWLSALAGSGNDLAIAHPREVLLAVREALHGSAGRKLDRLRIDLQPAVADALGLEGRAGVDHLMEQVHAAARRIEHIVASGAPAVMERAFGGPRRSGEARTLAPGVRLDDGALGVPFGAASTSEALLQLLAAHSVTGRPISDRALAWMQQGDPDGFEGPWTKPTLDAFIDLLKGPHSTSALEILDRVDGWTQLIPEWHAVRARAQYDPYHRYTVDAHLFLTVAEIRRAIEDEGFEANVAGEAGSLVELFLAGLMHDIGKGSGEDHSLAGEELSLAACRRMGLDDSATADVAALVRHHLLLPDTATRRDLDDPSVVQRVAGEIGSPRRLRLLYILAVADGRATGPEAWSTWKQSLVRELYAKVLGVLEGERSPPESTDLKNRIMRRIAPDDVVARHAVDGLPQSYFSSADETVLSTEISMLLALPEDVAIGRGRDGARLTLCMPDRPGALARAAGVLALHRISIRRVQGYSSSSGHALQRFELHPPSSVRWPHVEDDLRAVFSGRLAIDARLARKANDYRPPHAISPEIRVLRNASPSSTVIEVRAFDALGLLYAIAAGVTDVGFDIHVAKVDTLGDRVVDVFYVRTPTGGKLDEIQEREAEQAVMHRVSGMFR